MKAPKLSLRTCFKPFLALHRARRAFPFVSFGNGLPCPRQADNNTRAAFELWRSHEKNTHIFGITVLLRWVYIFTTPRYDQKSRFGAPGGAKPVRTHEPPRVVHRHRLPNARLLPARHINRKRRRQQRRGIRSRWELRPYPNIDTGNSRFRWLWTERRAGGLGCLAAGRTQQTQTHVFLFAI